MCRHACIACSFIRTPPSDISEAKSRNVKSIREVSASHCLRGDRRVFGIDGCERSCQVFGRFSAAISRDGLFFVFAGIQEAKGSRILEERRAENAPNSAMRLKFLREIRRLCAQFPRPAPSRSASSRVRFAGFCIPEYDNVPSREPASHL